MAENEAGERRLLLVGCGKMGSALLRGWYAAGVAERLVVVEPAGPPPGLADRTQVSWHASAETVPRQPVPEAVVFAVKPQVIDDVLPAYRPWVGPETLFLSIVAGKTLRGIERGLGPAALVRTMPNLPASIGRGFTVACANSRVTPRQKSLAERLIAAVGESAWVDDEALLDAVTAVSGSGPAYVFLLIEALAAAGVCEGLPAGLALRLAIGTVAGAGELARLSAEGPAELRASVTSPGGTTQAALDVLLAGNGLPTLVTRAVAAAAARSRVLAG